MKQFDIEAQGKLKVPEVSTRPSWTSDYIGVIIYEISSGKLLYGGSSSWVETGSSGGGASPFSILYNSQFNVNQRGVNFDQWSVLQPLVDGVCTSDRWILLTSSPDYGSVVFSDTALSRISLRNVSNYQTGILQILPAQDIQYLIGKSVSLRFKVGQSYSEFAPQINNVRVAVLYYNTSGGYIPNKSCDIVQTWNGNGTDPVFASPWTLLNTPESFAVPVPLPPPDQPTFTEYKIEGISIPSVSFLHNIAVFLWIDDDPVYNVNLYIKEFDLVTGSTFVEPIRRSYTEELQRCKFFCETNYPFGNWGGYSGVPLYGNQIVTMGNVVSGANYQIPGFCCSVQKYPATTSFAVFCPSQPQLKNQLDYVDSSGTSHRTSITAISDYTPIVGSGVGTVGVPYLSTSTAIASGNRVAYNWIVDSEFKKF